MIIMKLPISMTLSIQNHLNISHHENKKIKGSGVAFYALTLLLKKLKKRPYIILKKSKKKKALNFSTFDRIKNHSQKEKKVSKFEFYSDLLLSRVDVLFRINAVLTLYVRVRAEERNDTTLIVLKCVQDTTLNICITCCHVMSCDVM